MDRVIRVGDRVRIIKPSIFVRCGYPLCISDIKKELESKVVLDAMRMAGVPIPAYVLSSEVLDATTRRAYQQIAGGMALAIINQRGYGGNERRIYTKEDLSLSDLDFYIISKRTVVTGERYGWYRRNDFFGDVEDEPPGLTNIKRHIILSVESAVRYSIIYGDAFVHENFEIERANVVKLVHDGDIWKPTDEC